MSKVCLLLLILCPLLLRSQIFNPDVPALPDGELGQEYSNYVLATIPSNTTVSGADVSAMLIQQFPPLALFITEINGMMLPLTITSIEFSVSGLPLGMTKVCTPSTCRFNSNSTGSIVFGNAPSESGDFQVELASYTRGILDMAQILTLSGTPIPGIPTEFELPQGLHTLYDKTYSLRIEEPNGIGENSEVHGLVLKADRVSNEIDAEYLSANATVAKFKLLNAFGCLLIEGTVNVLEGPNRFRITNDNLPIGVYILHFETREELSRIKFVF